MSNFAILRTAKLKTMGNIGGSSAHVNRSLEEPQANIDSARTPTNEILVGSKNPINDVTEALPEKVRKNSVLCVENLLSASPEFFYGKSPEEIREWADESVASQQKFWGKENVVSATLHLDEKTPHIHLYAVPKVDGRLNCREFLGGRAKMTKMQAGYAKDMGKFRLERGIEGSKARHKTPAQVGGEAALQPRVVTKVLEVVTRRKKNIIGIEEVTTKKINVATAKTAKAAETEASKVPLLKNRINGLTDTISSKNNQLRKAQEKASVSILRDSDLMDLAFKMGYIQNEKDPKKWLTPQGTISINGQKFFDHSAGKGGGGGVDLVMYCESVNYKDSVALLRSTIGIESTMSEVGRKACKEVSRELKSETVPAVKPASFSGGTNDLKKWLTETRKIPVKLAQSWIDQGRVYASKFRDSWQAVFVHNDSAFMRFNPHNGFKGWVKGSDPQEFCFVKEPQRHKKTAVVEAHLDGLSLQVLEPKLNVCIAGTAGAAKKIAERLKADGHDVLLAVDNDPAGQKILNDSPEFQSIVSVSKDWNQDLMNINQDQHDEISNNQDFDIK